MIRDKRIAIGLGVGVVALAALVVAQQAGLGSGYRLREAGASRERDTALAAIDREPFRLRAWAEYGEVLNRPLFNDTRTPEPAEPVEGAAGGDGNTPPLNVTLTGVILSGELKLALVRDNAKGETQRVRVGQPLEGEQAGWTLIELEPRAAVFEGAGLGRQELELTVDTKGGGPAVAAPGAAGVQGQVPTFQTAATTPPPNTPGYTAPASAPAQTPGQPANAEEIRKRIEERRRQLREEAQKMMQQQNESKQ
jgi:general secretion pathway protein N